MKILGKFVTPRSWIFYHVSPYFLEPVFTLFIFVSTSFLMSAFPFPLWFGGEMKECESCNRKEIPEDCPFLRERKRRFHELVERASSHPTDFGFWKEHFRNPEWRKIFKSQDRSKGDKR